MVVFVAVILIAAVVGLVAYPFFVKEEVVVTRRPRKAERLRQLDSQLAAIESALQQLEIDLKSGAIAEEDYVDLKVALQRKAEAVRRGAKSPARAARIEGEDDIEKRVAELRRARSAKCPKCGALLRESDKFCPQCGAQTRAGR